LKIRLVLNPLNFVKFRKKNGKIGNIRAETQLTRERNRKILKKQNSVEFTELSTAFIDNSLTYPEKLAWRFPGE
jgi:hypothetical protein